MTPWPFGRAGRARSKPAAPSADPTPAPTTPGREGVRDRETLARPAQPVAARRSRFDGGPRSGIEVRIETPRPQRGSYAPKAPGPAVTDDDDSDRLFDHMGRRMLKRQVDALKSLPTFPESILRINELLSSEDPQDSFRSIAAIIEVDPVLCARILRLVNSAFYGASGAIVTVYDALVMLGLDIVKGIILSTSVMDLVSGHGSGARGLWEHSFGAAIAASAIGRVVGLPRVEELSAAALMHDLGKVVLAAQLSEEYPRVVEFAVREEVTIRTAELRTLGVGHDEIGRWLTARWKLPPVLAEPIAQHHAPSKAKRFPEAAAVVHVADLFVRGYGFGFPGDHLMPMPDDHAFQLLGLNTGRMRSAITRMHTDLQAALINVNIKLGR